ncbi:hypothetical protein FDUTEX481_00670 [Tolypothrix sp. PCC 7601]|nr:hypothetical protein FDUTEX481_00670 [Tolypothrix sp. PCC 7601]
MLNYGVILPCLKSLGNHYRQSVVETSLSTRSQMLDSIPQPTFIYNPSFL